MTNPCEYRPLTAEQFIGPAQELLGIIIQIASRGIKSGLPIRILIHGDPGVGKSALLEAFLHHLAPNRWNVTKYNGTELKIETVAEFARCVQLSNLYGGYRVLRVEEVDKASPAAQVRMLTLLDDLPHHTAVICTSNKGLEDFEPRFQSRFQVFSLAAPQANQIAWLLKKFGLRKDDIARIAELACGNVRQALNDAQSALDALRAVKGGAQ